MQLNHLSLPVPNVRETAAFFERFFNFTCTAIKGDGIIAVLQGEGNFLLVLNKLDELTQDAYPKDFHIGFMLQQQAEVTNMFNQLKEGGIDVGREPRKIRSTFGFYFYAPGGIMVEVACEMEG